MANAETTLQQQIRLAVGTRPEARIFRNQVGSLPDPRTGPAQRHDLQEIIVMTLSSVLCGADNWVDVAEWSGDNEDWLKNVVTSRAKAKIRESLKEEVKVMIQEGKGIVRRKFKQMKIVFDQENIGKSLKGDVSFAMLSQGFQQTFRNDSIKMRFYIYDRHLNKSNIAETPDFVLINITRN